MNRPRLWWWALFLVVSIILPSTYRLAADPPPRSPGSDVGCRAVREIRAEGGIVLPKGTEFRFQPNQLTSGGLLTLTLIVDDLETFKARFEHIENPSLMYHVTK